MNIEFAKKRLEQITKLPVIKGVRFNNHYIFEVDTPDVISQPFYAINDEGKISSFTPIDYLDEFFDVWETATVWIQKEYPEIVD